MRRKHLWVLAPLMLIPFLAGLGLRTHAPVDGQLLYVVVRAGVARAAVDSLSDDKIYESAARGLVNEIDDPYAELYSPEELASFSRNTLRNDYAGVGMQIQDQLGIIVVAAVFPNSPASKGGVQAGDRILMVDTAAVSGLKIDEVSGKLVGKPGTLVTVTFLRPGQEAQIQRKFTRAVVHVPAVPYALMLDNGVGYVPLQRFNEASAADVMTAVARLRGAGARSFVLDLRGNPGGSVDESVAISNLFLQPGQEIVAVRYRDREAEVRRAENDGVHISEPMIVMVDGGAASASEIVAGALQDHDRALVVGTTSFGKGVMQSIYPLHQGWALKLTTAKWFTPSGRSIQRERVIRNGQLVEARPDSLETDSSRRARPAYHSDAGRTVYGGGGIAPDVVVPADTITTAEQTFLRALGPKARESYRALYDLALDLRPRVQASFTVQPEWREDFFHRLETVGAPVTRAQFDAARPLVDRLLEQQLATLAFGDSSAFRRTAHSDAQLQRAVGLLRNATTQPALYVAAGADHPKG
jgi:carboxyl-terminal processing protease